MQNHSSYQYQ